MADANGGRELHQYRPLQSEQSLRLLELQPGNASDDIDFRLQQAELEDARDYETISYAWGDPLHKTRVYCDGKVVMVTQNLKDALLRLRRSDKPRILWADAICINQTDDEEKGRQVKMMGRIYERATRVCIWLGCATAQMQPAFGLIDEIVNYLNPANTQRRALPDPASDCWSALGIFFSAAWFNRLWVIQEANDRLCKIFCGEHDLSWKKVILVAGFLLDACLSRDLEDTYPFAMGNFPAVLQIDSAGALSSKSGLFDKFRNFSCSNQRDKVYALLRFPPLSDLRPPIQPDYSKTVAEVFEEAIVRIFESSGDLGLLSGLEHQGAIDEEGWPSWIPRWDRGRTTQILHNYSSGRVNSSFLRLKHRPNILTLGGVRISTISWCGEVVENLPGESVYGFPLLDYIAPPFQKLLLRCFPDVANLTESIFLCFAMTLTVGLDLDSKCPPRDLTQFRLDFLAYLAASLTSLNILSGTIQHLSELLKEGGPAGSASRFYAAAARGSRNKRFFCSVDGAFGVGPRAAQTGDIIVLLYGSNAPSVIRGKGAHYQFVGECYLHHHMHGEAIEMAAEGPSAVEDFELR